MVRNDIVNNNNYLRILPVGPNGDYGGFGTKVTVYQPGRLGDSNSIIGYQHAQSIYGYLCQNEPTLHFGLAQYSTCDLRLEFPNGIVRDLVEVQANQTLIIPAEVPEPSRLELYQFGINRGIAGKQLPAPVQVRVLDDKNSPIPNHPIHFELLTDGFINDHLRQVDVISDDLGIAKVNWTLGDRAGTENRLLVSSQFDGSPLQGSPLTVTVLAAPGPDTLLAIRSGNNQSGQTGVMLDEPLSVSASDSLNNPHAHVAVRFSAEPGNGLVNGESSVVVETDEQGIATVNWTLGDITEQMQVVSAGLLSDDQTKVLFYAENGFSTPSKLRYVSGDSCKGLVNEELPRPFVVKIVNDQNGPLSNYPVTFKSVDGGGHFNGAPEIQMQTNKEGLAIARPTLGSRAGNFLFEAIAKNQNGEHLAGSPRQFVARARTSTASRLVILSPDTLSGQAGNFSKSPVQVQILNDDGLPVPGHNVFFKVLEGSGKLGVERKDSLSMLTDRGGFAQVLFRFGDLIGENNTVLITSDDGVEALKGTPKTVLAIARYGQPDSKMSNISAPTSAIADGEKVRATVTLLDAHSNPVAGVSVVIQAVGEQVGVVQPKQPSDESGTVTAFISSTKAGIKEISAIRVDQDVLIGQTRTINFIAGPAHILEQVSGNQQSGTVNSVLAQPLVVEVFDKYRNLKVDEPVEFRVITGGGTALPAAITVTDVDGKASTLWKLGPLAGTQIMEASIAGGMSLRFQAQAGRAGTLSLAKLKGDNQFAAPLADFGDSLIVRVMDGAMSPVSAIDVTFSVLFGDVRLSDFHVQSDYFGRAGVFLQAGGKLGPAAVRAKLDPQTSVDFSCTVAQNVPAKIVVPQATLLNATVGEMLPLAVTILDEKDQPAAGVDVRFESKSDGLIFLGSTIVRTDSAGNAGTAVKVASKVGSYLVVASASGLSTAKVEFHIEAKAGAPHDLEIVDGDDQIGLPGALLDRPLVIKVSDQFGNSVPSLPIRFRIEAGGGKLLNNTPVFSNNSGIASAQWRLGSQGLQMVSVSSDSFPDLKTVFKASLLQNQLPELHAVADTTISEQQQLVFHLEANDPDGSISSVSVNGLPPGALFDSFNTHNFSWTPTFDQAGVYMLRFEATDNLGAKSEHSVKITVLNKNRPPAILRYSPRESDVYVDLFQTTPFSIQPLDLDNDQLSIIWSLNDRPMSEGPRCSFMVIPELPPLSKIKVVVSDSQDSTSRMWFVHVLNTKVELSAFTASAEGGVVSVTWQAYGQSNTAGFNLYRSGRVDGGYGLVNTKLIKVNETGEYRFYDNQVSTVGRLYYKLEEITNDGQTFEFEPIKVTIEIPASNKLFQNYPNPFNASTTIKFQLAGSADVNVSIYNLNGELVSVLFQGNAPAGYFSRTWDGRNSSGTFVSSGIYYCVMSGEAFRQSIKLLYLK